MEQPVSNIETPLFDDRCINFSEHTSFLESQEYQVDRCSLINKDAEKLIKHLADKTEQISHLGDGETHPVVNHPGQQCHCNKKVIKAAIALPILNVFIGCLLK